MGREEWTKAGPPALDPGVGERSGRAAKRTNGEGGASGTTLIAGRPTPPARLHPPAAYRVVAHNPHLASPRSPTASPANPPPPPTPNRAARTSATLGSQVRASVVLPSARARIEPNRGTPSATRAPAPDPALAAEPRIGSLPRSANSARSRRLITSRAKASPSPGAPGAHPAASLAWRPAGRANGAHPRRRPSPRAQRRAQGRCANPEFDPPASRAEASPTTRAPTACPAVIRALPHWQIQRGLRRPRRRHPSPHHRAAYRVVARIPSLPPRAAYRVVARIPSLTPHAAYRVVACIPSLAPHAAYRVVARTRSLVALHPAYRVVARIPRLTPRLGHRPLQPQRRSDRHPPRRVRRRLGPRRQPLGRPSTQRHRHRTHGSPAAHPKPSPRRPRPPPQPKARRHAVATRPRVQRVEGHLGGMLRRPQLLGCRVQPRRHPGRQIRPQLRRRVGQRDPRDQRPDITLRQPLRRSGHTVAPVRRLGCDDPCQTLGRARRRARPAMHAAPPVRHRQPQTAHPPPRPQSGARRGDARNPAREPSTPGSTLALMRCPAFPAGPSLPAPPWQVLLPHLGAPTCHGSPGRTSRWRPPWPARPPGTSHRPAPA